MFETFSQDLRYAARSLRRTPAFTAAAVATLALGIGANTAIFSLVEAVMLRTLPVRAPEQLHYIAHRAGEDTRTSSNFGWYERVQATDVFDGVAAYNNRSFKVAGDAGVEQVVGQYVSGNYHAVIGVPMALGRGFATENDRAAGSSPYAVISDAYWARRFGRSPDVLGRTMTVGGHVVTIIGVTAAGYEGLSPGQVVEVTLPLSIRIQDEPDFVSWVDSWTGMPLVGRLKEGVAPAAAEAAVTVAFREYVERPGMGPYWRNRGVALLPAARGDENLRREYEMPLRVLAATVVLVLFIACVNVANLLLVRGARRAREIAVRMSVGASRSRVLRQLVTESCLLGIAGGAAGLLIAAWTTPFMTGLVATGQDPVIISAELNSLAIAFAIAVSIGTGTAFGLAPALFATRVDLNTTLKEGDARGGRRPWGRQVLVAAQLALSLVLLCGSVLLVRTLGNLRAVDAGMATDNVLMFGLDAFDTPLPEARMVPLCTSVRDRIRLTLGATQASCSTSTPVDDGFDMVTLSVPTPPPGPDADDVYTNDVTPDYFRTLGVDVLRGRAFGESDVTGAPLVAIVNESFARFYFPGQDALGRRISLGTGAPQRTIVGIVKDAMLMDLRSAAPRMAYRPLAQTPQVPRQLTVSLRTGAQPAAVGATIRAEVARLSPDIAVTYIRTMEQQVARALTTERLLATLFSGFAGLALLLACVGVYGVTSFEVGRRRREIGIRLALGATRRIVLTGMLRQTAVTAGAGVIIGIAAAAVASLVLSRFLFGVDPQDPVTLAVTGLILAGVALLAGYIPAGRASRIEPTIVLRAE
jgi:predicted permease